MLRTILERADLRGEIRDEALLEPALNLLVGAFYARYLQTSQVPASFTREVVEMVWKGLGLASQPAPSRTRHS